MSDQEADEVDLTDEELSYKEARLGFVQADRMYNDASEALELWKSNHKEVAIDRLNPELCQLENEIMDANQLLMDANQLLTDSNQLRMDAARNKQQRTEEMKRLTLVPNWSEWNAIIHELCLEKTGELVAVPKTFFGTNCRNGLFVREEYNVLARRIDTKLESDKRIDSVLVVGSPGIGKSVFGVLLFLLAIKKEKNVAYHPLQATSTYYFTWNGKKHDVATAPQEGTRYEGYFDGNESGCPFNYYLFSHIFLFASPHKDNYNQFVKDNCLKVYLNPWGKQECEKFAELLRYKDDEWLPKFNLVGGVPRYLFSSSYQYENLLHDVRKAIPPTVAELSELIWRFGIDGVDDQRKHMLFTLNRNNDSPSRSYVDFSSLGVEVIMKSRYDIGLAHEIRSLLTIPASNMQSWQGQALERSLLQDLATTRFSVKSLERPRARVEARGPFNAKTKPVQAASEIQFELMLYVPISENYPAIDGVLVVPDNELIIYVQAAGTKAHPIKLSALKNIYEHLTQLKEFQGCKHELLFIVSEDMFDDFRLQPYKNDDGLEDGTALLDIPLKQYVGKII